MNIIFIANNMAKAKTLSAWHIIALVVSIILLTVIATVMLIVPQEQGKGQAVKQLLSSPLQFSKHFTQQHLDAMALQLGEIQARMMQLDAQSQRLSKLAGEKDKSRTSEHNSTLKPNSGGPLVQEQPMTQEKLEQQIALLSAELDLKTEYLSAMEVKLIQKSMQKSMIPSGNPVNEAYNSSSFGWRVDPFTGRNAFHEGLDFTAATGTPIYAAAGGIVTNAGRGGAYGNLIKIDHGGELETRYAHLSKIQVKEGDVVKKGQLIGYVGSTGRSTGPHLHFEIRRFGAALDPRQFIAK